jgi:hypothetical protein
MRSIEKLTEQYEKEVKLARQHGDRAKAIAEQIKYIKGEECNTRINRLNLTAEQFQDVLKLLDSRESLLDAIGHGRASGEPGQGDGRTDEKTEGGDAVHAYEGEYGADEHPASA